MSAICLLDTSVFVEILKVPGKSQKHTETLDALGQKIEANETLFLPMATILETGNHIGQNGDGNQRRQCAQRFVDQVKKALEGESPFKPISFLQREELQEWLSQFPEHANRGSGLGDLTIIQDWERQCEITPNRRVYIWTLDGHLASYEQNP